MSSKPGYRRDGSRIKRPDARANARPRKVLIKHGSNSHALMHAPFDMRSVVGKAYQHRVRELSAHVGGDPNSVQRTLIDHGARLHLLTRMAWRELSEHGAYRGGAPTPANESYVRAAASERSVLLLLGLERKAREIPDLQDYLRSKAKPRLLLKGPVEDAAEIGR